MFITAAVLLAVPTSSTFAADPGSASGAAPAPEKEVTANVLTTNEINQGDTAWMLTSTGLVMLMVPGLALFYGGMVRRKNILGTMMHSMVALSIIGILWVIVGYALAFGDSQGGIIGWNPRLIGLSGIIFESDGKWGHHSFAGTNIPIIVHCMYQGMFAIITPALISGAFAERIRFGPYCLFILLWGLLVYCPLAHWVWAADSAGNPVGWLGRMGALDFAGGTVVHIAAGVSGLAAILLLRKRIGYPEHAMHPSSMVLTLLGAGLLWFGWFGFNGGSALGSNGGAGGALAASQVAAAAAALTWLLVEWRHKGKPTALGFASGLVAGLVAVTPASGFVNPLGALAIGAIAGLVCYGAVCLKPRFKYDDSLDAFGVHGVGGFLGAVLTGVFVSAGFYLAGGGSDAAIETLTKSGRLAQVGVQLLAACVSTAFAFAVTAVLVKGIDSCFGFCLDTRSEGEGLDRSEHGEVGFETSSVLEMVLERPLSEPRPAAVPPNGYRHFTVVLDGIDGGKLTSAWSSLCQAGAAPPSAAFRAVYPYVTTVQGNRFHFRGGDPNVMTKSLRTLFEDSTKTAGITARVEE
jgi:ammonium transporter